MNPLPLQPGDRVAGRYLLLAALGEGGMAVVFEALDEQLQRRVALKILRRISDIAAARFEREARAANAIRHPAVVPVFAVGRLSDGRPYLALELVDGEPLNELVARVGPLPAERALHLLLPAVGALAEAHAAGIIHRDLKPSNLIVQHAPGQVEQLRLLDFGIAAWDEPDGRRLTRTGEVFGTPEFMAPEQAMSRPVTPATDVWAIGAVLYELLSGNLPFLGNNAPSVLFKVVNEAPPPLPPSVPAEVAALVEACLQKRPTHRPADAGVLLQQMEALLLPPRRELASSRPADGALKALATAPPTPPPALAATQDVPVKPAEPSRPSVESLDPPTQPTLRRGRGLLWPLLATALVVGGSLGVWWALKHDSRSALGTAAGMPSKAADAVDGHEEAIPQGDPEDIPPPVSPGVPVTEARAAPGTARLQAAPAEVPPGTAGLQPAPAEVSPGTLQAAEMAAPGTAGLGPAEAPPGTVGLQAAEAAPGTADLQPAEAPPGTVGLQAAEVPPGTAGLRPAEVPPGTADLQAAEAPPGTAGLQAAEVPPGTAGLRPAEVAAPGTAGLRPAEVAAPGTAVLQPAEPETAGLQAAEVPPGTAGFQPAEPPDPAPVLDPAPDPALDPARALLARGDTRGTLRWLARHPTTGSPTDRLALEIRTRLARNDLRSLSKLVQKLLSIDPAAVDGPLQAHLLLALVEQRYWSSLVPALADPRLYPRLHTRLVDLAQGSDRTARTRAIEVMTRAGKLAPNAVAPKDAAPREVAAPQAAPKPKGTSAADRVRSIRAALAREKDCYDRKALIETLGRLGHPSALPVLQAERKRGAFLNMCMGHTIDDAMAAIKRRR